MPVGATFVVVVGFPGSSPPGCWEAELGLLICSFVHLPMVLGSGFFLSIKAGAFDNLALEKPPS